MTRRLALPVLYSIAMPPKRVALAATVAVTATFTVAACVGDNPAPLLRDTESDAGGVDSAAAADATVPPTDGSPPPDSSTLQDANVELDAAAPDAAAPDASNTDAGADASADAGADAAIDAGPVNDAGPVAWYAGDFESDGGIVWKDSSGRGHDLRPVGTPPTIAVSGGKNVAHFTTPASGVSCLHNSGLTVPAARSMYAVALLTRWFASGKNYESTLLGFGGKQGGFATVVRPGPSPRWISGNVELPYNGGAVGDINVVKLFAVRDDGATALDFTLTGNTSVVTTPPYLGGAATGGVYLGCDPASDLKQWDGIIAEVMIFDRRLDDAEHMATINALKAKWAIP